MEEKMKFTEISLPSNLNNFQFSKLFFIGSGMVVVVMVDGWIGMEWN